MSDKIIHIQTGITIPEYLLKEVQSKLAYIDPAVDAVRVDVAGHVHLTMETIPEKDRVDHMQKAVLQIVSTLTASARAPEITVLEDHLARKVPFQGDPMELLLATGEAHRESRGLFSLGPILSRIVRYIQLQLDASAFTLGADLRHFPAMIPASYLEKVRYFKSFPHSLTFVSHLREDLAVLENFSKSAHCQGETIHMPDKALADVRNLLSPAVCYHNYLALAGKTLPKDPTITTAMGQCFRFESSNLDGLERLWNFSMWEVIFVGSKPQVLAGIAQAAKAGSHILQKLGLAFRIESANDPFFIGEFGTQMTYQYAYDLKYEFLAALPYKNGLFAVGSRNYHMDFFGRVNEIKTADGGVAHTGCVAFGLERLAYAFIAQYGLDQTLWPSAVRDEIFAPIVA